MLEVVNGGAGTEEEEEEEEQGGAEMPIDWNYPVIQKGSKLGVHSILRHNTPEDARTLVDNGTRYAVVKAVNDLGWLADVKSKSPDTVTIGRIAHSLEGCEGVNDPNADLDKMADKLLQPILDRLSAEPNLRNAVDYDFPPQATLAPSSALVVVPFELSDSSRLRAFVDEYRIDELVAIFGGYSGRLSDVGETVRLERPGETIPNPPGGISRLLEDRVGYDEDDPWPAGANGGGLSLQRSAVDVWGDSPHTPSTRVHLSPL